MRMNYNIELRYYEILFIRMVNNFHHYYKRDKLIQFIETLSIIAEANITLLTSALQTILTDPFKTKFLKEEYIVCLKLCTNLKDTEIRKILRCSPNTIQNAMTKYETEQLYIHPVLPLAQVNEIKKIMQSLKQISTLY